MEFVSFVGRVLFVSVFILSAWQEFNEFGIDGGPAVRTLRPKFNVFSRHVLSQTAIQLPAVKIKHLVAAAIALRESEAFFSYLAALLELFFCSFIKLLPFLSCMTSITMMLAERSLLNFLSNSLRIWHFLGHCSFSLASRTRRQGDNLKRSPRKQKQFEIKGRHSGFKSSASYP
ncbi:hypothetical protein Nepgr_031055 [Nepenthes gracilis]|uniref:Uncharacterized protein n=1 Tax=Nepenthes gracilis TaxID=150966 RepID=A0AAD3TGT4_NEPGR|nr:hypothetical protein Nepgr_031055 [Nepenthes gracilis]